MIEIDLGILEFYDSESNQFMYEQGGKVYFEYSLKVLYDWESKWKKPFFKGELTEEELTDFYVTMASKPINPQFLNKKVREQLQLYIQDEHTATKFTTHDNSKRPKMAKGKIHTAEEIYAMMFSASIPLDFEERNLNKLLVVLRITSAQSEPPKKMSKHDILRQNADLNRQRREAMKTKG